MSRLDKIDFESLILPRFLFLYIHSTDPKVLKFNKVHMRTHRRSGLLISKFAL